MHNELFKIGPVTIYGYGLMIALGIVLAYRLASYRAAKRQMDLSLFNSLAGWSIAGGFVGAKLLYWITQARNIVEDPSIILNLAEGFVIYGGIIGGIATGYLYCRIKKMNFIEYLDLCVPSIALAQGFGRIGCLLAGCCYGEETHGWWGITFHHSDFAPNDVSLVPTQILESVFSFALCILLLQVSKRTNKAGLVAGLYLILYSVARFIIEFYRGDLIRGEVGLLSTSQIIALIVIAVTSVAVFLSRNQNKAAA